jgi:UDP-N-acetylglucosamine acyltransferase
LDCQIHPNAIIGESVELGVEVTVGPGAIIEDGVRVGDRCHIGPYVHIQGSTGLGSDNTIGNNSLIGFPPQYVGFDGSPTPLIIGDRNTIREQVTIHRSLKEDSPTSLGDDNYLMTQSHVGHDCKIGNGVIISNAALIAGHVEIGDKANISGHVAVHQFVRIGRLVMVGGMSRIKKDIPPFVTVEGFTACIRCLNSIGLKRADIPAEVQRELKAVFKELKRTDRLISETLASINTESLPPEVIEFLDFHRDGKRGVTPYSGRPDQEDTSD